MTARKKVIRLYKYIYHMFFDTKLSGGLNAIQSRMDRFDISLKQFDEDIWYFDKKILPEHQEYIKILLLNLFDAGIKKVNNKTKFSKRDLERINKIYQSIELLRVEYDFINYQTYCDRIDTLAKEWRKKND